MSIAKGSETMTIKIVTDSSVELTPAEIKQYDIRIVPLNIIIDGQNYVDGRDITKAGFMGKMAAAKALPTTSQPAIGDFLTVYDELGQAGNQILSIHMTENLSGTVNAARQAGVISTSDVTVVDSGSIDRGLAFQVLAAAKMAQDGAEIPAILKQLAAIRDRTKVYLAVSTLANLVKGGRVGRVTGLVSSFLNIKVVLELTLDGLHVVAKGRGQKTLTKFVDEQVTALSQLPNVASIGIPYAGDEAVAQQVGRDLRAVLPEVPIVVTPTSPIVATHTGPGAFAIIYYTEPE
ncbi:DegV domain-containing protein [Schleiferilactobacillus shenzhenensis LY-73]|uniref:DegV domain-containing protein n=2 Tax=Schleiferilactobacillus shenzhenensis TaxID=1231337 RepID=U4TNW3_9LACO|nr:DegV domain-containing protein [Schleiferilactobacillus shenzhenensis LY-73]